MLKPALVLSFVFMAGCAGTPQLGPDEESFKAVDALYTAVTSRRADLLSACETKVKERHAAGQLPDKAWTELSAIIAISRDNKWEAAAERLHEFMKKQEMRRGIESKKPAKR